MGAKPLDLLNFFLAYAERMSRLPARCGIAKIPGLLDHPRRHHQQRLRHREAERTGGLETDDEIESRRLLERNHCRVGAAQDLVD